MSYENSYEVSLTGTTMKTIEVEILDTRWTIKDILQSEEFPIDSWPCGDGDWSGYISIDGKTVARYCIGEADLCEEIEYVVLPDGDYIKREELE